jgi:hypothetical protein
MASGYYIRERSAEWEAVQRWENEGGRFPQHHDYSFGPIGEDYQRPLDQAVPSGTSNTWNKIAHAMLSFPSDEPQCITGQTLRADDEQTLPETVRSFDRLRSSNTSWSLKKQLLAPNKC